MNCKAFVHFSSSKFFFFALAIGLLAGVSACNRSAESVPAPTATADPALAVLARGSESTTETTTEAETAGETVPETSMPTSPPAPAPTVTPRPEEELALGETLLRYGEYGAARDKLTAALAALDPGDPAAVQARLDLARAYLLDDYFTEALNELDTLRTGLSADSTAESASLTAGIALLRGKALTGLQRADEALQAYAEAEATFSGLAAVTGPLRAQLYLSLQDTDNALGAYRQAADVLRDSGDTVAYVLELEALAEVARNTEDYAAAVAAYDEILGVAQNPGYRADIQERAGQTLAAAGDTAGALARWLAATEEAPTSDYAYAALVELVARDVAFDLYQRAYIDLAAEAWYPAINAYQSFLATAASDDPRRGRALQELGVAYIGAGDYPTAIATLDRTLLEYPACDCLGDAWLAKAQALSLQGDRVGARRTYRTFAREHPDHPQAAYALWLSGLSAFGDNNQIEAGLDLLTLADAFPDDERTPDALYILGLGALQNGLTGQSAEFYARLRKDYPNYRPAAADYWRGRALAATGNDAQAQAAWQAALIAPGGEYYTILADVALQTQNNRTNVLGVVPQLVDPKTRLEGDDGSQAFAQQWLATWISVPADDLPALPAASAADRDWALLPVLLNGDERAEALRVADRLWERYKDDPHALYAMTLAFEELEFYRLSLISAARLLNMSPAAGMEDAPLFLQQKVYPRPFADLIAAEAEANGLDPLLYFSLIRQESQFEEGARSFAAAQGLAQIIPDTGQWVATQLGYPNYSNDLIYRPAINLKFGAYYLAWVRDYLEGDLIGALVGYNAGPGNAKSWREQFGVDDPLYVERLTYSEPRLYIQTILPNYYHYNRLYGE
ncbi:MAG: transglycosylase SLT domain-containing protein [Caldilineaceae bacterium]|nr:transglycosylase SLT domain-containing protein [Caldilineaceae bacterium]